MNTNSVFPALSAAVKPLLKAYFVELEADGTAIANNPGMPFLHWTRPLGTNLVLLPPADSACYPPEGEIVPYIFGTADRWHISREKLAVAKIELRNDCQGDKRTCHYFNGITLRLIDCHRAVQVAQDYLNGLHSAWNRQAKALAGSRR